MRIADPFCVQLNFLNKKIPNSQIYVSEDFEIESAFCSCPEKICHHIGALALHSGFKTPLFSYLPQKRTVADDADVFTNSSYVDDKKVKMDDQFVVIKNKKGFIVETYDTDWVSEST